MRRNGISRRLPFPISELRGRGIRWSIGDGARADALARSARGDTIIEVENCGVADDWYIAALRANGQPVPRGWRSWRPDPVDPDLVLLARLAEQWPDGAPFDVTSISCRVWDAPKLRPALTAIGIKFNKSGHLSRASHSRLNKWLWKVHGKPLGGLVLDHDHFGWCRISRCRAS